MARLEVITGPMFSGKTKELVRRLEVARDAEGRLLIVCSTKDKRKVRSIRENIKKEGRLKNYRYLFIKTVDSIDELKACVNEYQPNVLAIEEGQFFKKWLVKGINKFLDLNGSSDFRIIVSGLDMNGWREPFGVMPELMARADDVQKLTAICFKCKKPANLTYVKNKKQKKVKSGDKDLYEARCRLCHKLPE